MFVYELKLFQRRLPLGVTVQYDEPSRCGWREATFPYTIMSVQYIFIEPGNRIRKQ